MKKALQTWLQEKITEEHKGYSSAEKKLLNHLKDIQTIEHFSKEIDAMLLYGHKSSNSLFFSRSCDEVFMTHLTEVANTITSWQKVLKEIQIRLAQPRALTPTTAVIDLINEILDNPQFLLHEHAQELLVILDSPTHFLALLRHLDQQPPYHSYEGCDTSLSFESKSYIHCLQLAENNRAAFQKIPTQRKVLSSNYKVAAHLLDITLTIYRDTHILVPEDDLEKNSNACCIIG